MLHINFVVKTKGVYANVFVYSKWGTENTYASLNIFFLFIVNRILWDACDNDNRV